ncbi:hypothetical protein BTUL_0127g00090 [Botrytis tulipae]|uniref:Uncharacterized protein n=1 Tax=Botrytis tulipae TaxID=87230 RepID=A0A4Z1EGV2_9HELO|nr:hypothetical protein BTUL_0127g00090 [Botrytis tulipae]
MEFSRENEVEDILSVEICTASFDVLKGRAPHFFLTISGRALAATVTSTTLLLEQGQTVEKAVVWSQYVHFPSLVAVDTAPKYFELTRLKKRSSAWFVAGMALKPENSLSV